MHVIRKQAHRTKGFERFVSNILKLYFWSSSTGNDPAKGMKFDFIQLNAMHGHISFLRAPCVFFSIASQ